MCLVQWRARVQRLGAQLLRVATISPSHLPLSILPVSFPSCSEANPDPRTWSQAGTPGEHCKLSLRDAGQKPGGNSIFGIL